MKLKKLGWCFLCLLSGMLMTLAFAPFNVWILAFVGPTALCAAWLQASPRQALLRGWLFGFGWAITGGSWVFVSMHTYGGDSIIVAGLLTALLAGLLALYPALQGFVLNRFFHGTHTKVLLAFPALWVAFEYLRAHLFTGVPWMLLGNSQVSSWFGGYAPLDSVYLVSLVVALIAALLVTIMRCQGWMRYACVLGIIALTGLGYGLTLIQWTYPISKPIGIALVQGNIPQSTKWDPNVVNTSLSRYADLTVQHWDSPLIIWPESAIPLFESDAPTYFDDLDHAAKLHHTAVLFGVPMINPQTHQFYNAAGVLGNGRGKYYKHHLVPFGEYIPLHQWIGNFLQFLTIPMDSFTPGPALQPLMDMQNLKVAVFICFESAFPAQVRYQLQNANFIATLTDDGWFGKSLGPYQHEQIDQMRALENARYLVRATNNGVTSIINTHGQVVARAPMDQATVLTGTIVPVSGETPWMYFGLFPMLCLIILMLLIAWIRQR